MRYTSSRAEAVATRLLLLLVVSILFLTTIPAIAAVNIRGIVLGADDKPVPGVTVAFPNLPGYTPAQHETKTDGAGRFNMDGERTAATPGTAARAGEAASPLQVLVLIVAPDYGVTGASLREGENTIRLARASQAGGLVQSAQGEPVAGVTLRLRSIRPDDPMQAGGYVTLEPFPSMTALYSVRTGADGRWKMTGLPQEGMAQVEVDDERFARVSQLVSLGAAEVEAPVIRVQPGTTIKGRVLLDDGNPAAGITVSSQVAVRGGMPGAGYAQNKTGEDGHYSLHGLPEGEYNIQAVDPKGERVAPATTSVKTRAGEPVVAPDITLGRGLLLEGTVIDDETEEPLAGAVLTAQGSFGNTRSTTSDAQGRYTIRVLPGSVRFYFANTPEGYVRQSFSRNMVEVTAGQKSIPPYRLKRGITVRGIAVDESGKPATGAVIMLGSQYLNAQAPVGSDGKWVITGLNPEATQGGPQGIAGAPKLSAAGEWAVVRPEVLIVPTERSVEVVLKRIKLHELEGRVVTPDGEPVPGATIQFRIARDAERAGGWTSRQKTTDTAGRFRLGNLRPELPVTLSAEKVGYAYISGGNVDKRGETWRVSDVILTPLNAQVAGQVVDANGVPATAARVAIVDSAASGPLELPTTTDEQGRFVFKNLAKGRVRIIAAHGSEFGEATVATGQEARVELRARPAMGTPTVERAGELIAQWIKDDDEREAKSPRRRDEWRPESARYIARLLSPRDPDLALQLATSKASAGGKNEDRMASYMMAIIIARLVRHDPKRAAAWAPLQIEKMKPGAERTSIAGDLALAVASTEPALARRIMESEAASLKPKDFSMEAAMAYAYLAALASRLDDPRAELWLQALQVALEQGTEEARRGDSAAYYMKILAGGTPQLAERLLETLEPPARLHAMERLVVALSRRDLAAARQQLTTMETLAAMPEVQAARPKDDQDYYVTPQQSLDTAYEAVARELAPIDDQAAYEIARKIKGDQRPGIRPLALAEVARHMKGEAAARVYREAAQVQQEYWNLDSLSTIAAMAHRHDPALGEEIFELARKRLAVRLGVPSSDELNYTFADYAYFRAPIDHAESRLLLEAEWARRMAYYERTRETTGNSQYSSNSWRLGRIAHAMVAVDFERALEMAGIAAHLEGNYYDARPHLINFMLATPAERAAMPFQQQLHDEFY